MVKSGCFYPWYKKGEKQPIPCGKCPLCRKRNTNGWQFRTMKQLDASDSAHMITLTYNDANVPFTPNGLLGLSKKHLQDFFKRLRKAHEPKRKALRAASSGRLVELSGKRVTGKRITEADKRIKYIAVGEYGGRTFRPHYHILFFNCKIELIQKAWSNPVTAKHMGSVHYGDERGVSDMAAAYCLSYLNKPSMVTKEKWDDRPKEFKLVSKGFGLGYLSEQQIAWHLAKLSDRMYCVMTGGKKVSMPRYYKNKIYTELQKETAFQIQTEQLIKQQLRELMHTDARKLLKEKRSWEERRKGMYREMYRKTSKHKV